MAGEKLSDSVITTKVYVEGYVVGLPRSWDRLLAKEREGIYPPCLVDRDGKEIPGKDQDSN